VSDDVNSLEVIYGLIVDAIDAECGISKSVDYPQAGLAWQQVADIGSSYAERRLASLYAKKYIFNDATGKIVHGEGMGKVLIIDDGEDTLEIISLMIRKVGLQPVTATDGLDALEKTLTHYHLMAMLIDLQMPNMNGFEFISTLREQHAFEDVPIVVITAHTSPALVRQGQKFGVHSWLTKPIEFQKVEEIFASIIQDRAAQRNTLGGLNVG